MCERVTRLELTALKKVKRYANTAEGFHTHTHRGKTLTDLSFSFADMPEGLTDLKREYFKIVKDNFLNIFFSFFEMLLK